MVDPELCANLPITVIAAQIKLTDGLLESPAVLGHVKTPESGCPTFGGQFTMAGF